MQIFSQAIKSNSQNSGMKLILPASCPFRASVSFSSSEQSTPEQTNERTKLEKEARTSNSRAYTMIHRVNRYPDCTILRMARRGELSTNRPWKRHPRKFSFRGKCSRRTFLPRQVDNCYEPNCSCLGNSSQN